MFALKIRRSIQLKYLATMSVVLLVALLAGSYAILSIQRASLEASLISKGTSLIAYMAKLTVEPLLMLDFLTLDGLVEGAAAGQTRILRPGS